MLQFTMSIMKEQNIEKAVLFTKQFLRDIIDEKISIDEYLRGIEVLKKTIQHLKRLHDKTK